MSPVILSPQTISDAEVKFPSDAKMREFADMVQAREPLVDDIIGFMDGVSDSMH